MSPSHVRSGSSVASSSPASAPAMPGGPSFTESSRCVRRELWSFGTYRGFIPLFVGCCIILLMFVPFLGAMPFILGFSRPLCRAESQTSGSQGRTTMSDVLSAGPTPQQPFGATQPALLAKFGGFLQKSYQSNSCGSPWATGDRAAAPRGPWRCHVHDQHWRRSDGEQHAEATEAPNAAATVGSAGDARGRSGTSLRFLVTVGLRKIDFQAPPSLDGYWMESTSGGSINHPLGGVGGCSFLVLCVLLFCRVS